MGVSFTLCGDKYHSSSSPWDLGLSRGLDFLALPLTLAITSFTSVVVGILSPILAIFDLISVLEGIASFFSGKIMVLKSAQGST